jgi:hypothetical protein
VSDRLSRGNVSLFFAYNLGMGEMKRRDAREADQRDGSRYVSTLVIAAAIIAAVRLHEKISESPRRETWLRFPTVSTWRVRCWKECCADIRAGR